jgi:hypothetical protein
MELTNEGHEDSDKPCTWNVLFNLIIPGWLPATAVFGELMKDAGTCYALFATAKFATLDDANDKAFSLSTLCSVFRPRTKAIEAQMCPVTLRRFMNSPFIPSSPISLFPMSNYAIIAKPEHADATQNSSPASLDVFSKIQVVASTPDYLSTDEESVPLVIRLRAADLEDDECKRLQVVSFSVDIRQTEKYR